MKNLQKLKDQYRKLGEEIEKLEKEGEYKGYGKRLKRYEDIPVREGCFIADDSNIYTATYGVDVGVDKNLFPYKHQAEAVLALSQLLQLREEYIGRWKPEGNLKYNIYFSRTGVSMQSGFNNYEVLSFPTEQMRDDFAEDHKELIEEFGKLYI